MLSEQHPLSQALLVQTLESYQLASRSRQQRGTVLAALARQEGIPLPEDWSVRSGGTACTGLATASFPPISRSWRHGTGSPIRPGIGCWV